MTFFHSAQNRKLAENKLKFGFYSMNNYFSKFGLGPFQLGGFAQLGKFQLKLITTVKSRIKDQSTIQVLNFFGVLLTKTSYILTETYSCS